SRGGCSEHVLVRGRDVVVSRMVMRGVGGGCARIFLSGFPVLGCGNQGFKVSCPGRVLPESWPSPVGCSRCVRGRWWPRYVFTGVPGVEVVKGVSWWWCTRAAGVRGRVVVGVWW